MAIPLNPAQRQAVEHHEGPLLVLAGAGSGKTRVITQRIARLVERGVPANAILALTFTNKAAGEMAERVGRLMKERGHARGAEGLTVSTFHSFGLMVLTREKKQLGGTFTIFDQGDQLAAVKDILGRMDAGRAFDASAIVARISNAKNAFLSAEDLAVKECDDYDEITKLVYPRYQAALRNFRAFDFDDLVCEVARMWRDKADVLARWQERFRYVLVDEYQDTNGAQLALLTLLAKQHRNLCVVGDDDQSIYAWRGADLRNILMFEAQFPGAVVVKLEQNYRSFGPILAVANAVLEKRPDEPGRHRKVLFTEKKGGDKVVVATAPSPEAEAMWVAHGLRARIKDERRRPRDLAVLYRSNGQAKMIEDALREQGVPYRVVGGQTFFERKEVKDLLSYLKLALNEQDEIALRRVLNYPPRGIGETSVERLGLHALAKGWTLWKTIERVDALDDIPPVAREGCKALEGVVGELKKRLLVDGDPASVVARDLCERAGIKRDLDANSGSTQAAARRWANVEGLLRTFANKEARDGKSDRRSLAAFLHALTLTHDDAEADDASDVVTLSTLHGSKGLEFDVVYLVGCEEGLLPHARTLDARATDATVQDVEEERRLFYVGVTRARQRLFLSKTRHRVVRGKPVPRTPSRFVVDLPPELVDEVDIKEITTMAPEDMVASGENLLALLGQLGK